MLNSVVHGCTVVAGVQDRVGGSLLDGRASAAPIRRRGRQGRGAHTTEFRRYMCYYHDICDTHHIDPPMPWRSTSCRPGTVAVRLGTGRGPHPEAARRLGDRWGLHAPALRTRRPIWMGDAAAGRPGMAFATRDVSTTVPPWPIRGATPDAPAIGEVDAISAALLHRRLPISATSLRCSASPGSGSGSYR